MAIKVGIIRCLQTEDFCPASTCLANAKTGEGGYAETGPVEVIGVNTCGGCPGKKAISRAREMKRRGADKIVLASCILKGTPGDIGYSCPFGSKMKKLIEEKVGIEVIGWTH